MQCEKCGTEMRVDSRALENGIEQSFSCRDPQCSAYRTVQKQVRVEMEETDDAGN